MKYQISNIKYQIFFFLLLTTYYLLLTFPVHAQSPVPIGSAFGFGDIESLGEGTSRLVGPVFQVTAAIVVIYFLIGAFFYIKAGGNKEEVERARNMINHAIVGFFILMLAFLIIQFLLSRFGITIRLIG